MGLQGAVKEGFRSKERLHTPAYRLPRRQGRGMVPRFGENDVFVIVEADQAGLSRLRLPSIKRARFHLTTLDLG